MRAWVAGFDSGRFNASRRQILPMLACEKPKIEEQTIVTWTGLLIIKNFPSRFGGSTHRYVDWSNSTDCTFRTARKIYLNKNSLSGVHRLGARAAE